MRVFVVFIIRMMIGLVLQILVGMVMTVIVFVTVRIGNVLQWLRKRDSRANRGEPDSVGKNQ